MKWMGFLMMLLVATMSIAPVTAAEGDTTTVEVSADVDGDTAVVVTTDAEAEVEVETEADTETRSTDECVDAEGNTVLCETLADDSGLAEVETETEVEATAETVAAASATAEVDEQTAAEVEAMGTMHGAQMRLAQLEKHIRRSVVVGNEVIAQLETQANASANATAGLEAIVAQLEALATEAEAARLELNGSTNVTSQAAVAAFLDIKADAKALIKEFRDTAKPLLRESDVERVKTRAEVKVKAKEAELEVEIEERRKEHNKVRARVLLENIGDAELAAEIAAGDLTAEEIRTRIKARFDALTEEQKKEAAEKLREGVTKLRVARADAVMKVREEAGERAVLRLEERAEWLREKNLTQAADMLERNAERIASRERLTVEERAELRAKLGDRLEIREKLEMRDGDTEVRMERRERLRDGQLEIRERIRTRTGTSGGDRVETETEIEVEEDNSGSGSSDDDEVRG